MKQWDPQSVKQAIDMELEFGTVSVDDSTSHITSEGLARNKARAATPVAMDSIIHLATYSENESIRLKAATYIVDRVLGRIGDVPMDINSIDTDDPLTRLVKAFADGN